MLWLVSVLVGALWTAPAMTATEDDDTAAARVVVVRLRDQTRASPQTERTVVDELEVTGYDVVAVPGVWSTSEDAPLAAVAAKHDAAAAIGIQRSHPWIVGEVFIAGSSTPIVRRIDANASTDASTVLALQLVEVLNASRVHVVPGTPAPAPDPTPPPPAPAWPRWTSRVGLSALFAPPDVGVLGGPTVGTQWGFAKHFAVDLDITASAINARLEGAESTARIGVSMARAQLLARLRPHERVGATFGLGAGPLVAWAAAKRVAEPLQGRTDVTAVAIAVGSASLTVRIARRMILGAHTNAAVALPAVRIFFTDDVQGVVGRPLLDLGVSVGWVWR